MKHLIISCLLLALTLCQASYIPATTGIGLPVGNWAAGAVPAVAPPLFPAASSHQFVTRNYNGYYVPTTTSTAWPPWSAYPNTYYKYSGGYPTYTYPYSYPYGYYPSYGYGYNYKSVW